ncbi:MAG TPA: glycosyltransferase [Streptosporangiaceae bacterium]|nr:glycosyltransferase [Streptosporangiaceae bacterium]
MAHDFGAAAEWVLVALVILAAGPQLAGSWQFLLVAVHFRRNHYAECQPYFPRTAILIPAWNEAAVVGNSIDHLMSLDYPEEALRIFVVDDASTDATPEVVAAKAARYSGRVVHLRRERGGEGKAHTLNHGLSVILGDDWMQALLIMDADVVYERDTLRKMTRHLADRNVGAVTAYIKEGSRPGNYLTRFIGYEYITAQTAARRSQNVIGAIACLAGGAQLHSRANLVLLGGRVDTSSLAEDTFTTFNTQIAGHRVVFEPHATVWAEEPSTIVGLWKQRMRWARGNFQVTVRFRRLWFHRSKGHHLGGINFGVFWFCVFLLPFFMITASASLVTLYFINFPLAWRTFHVLWITNAATYLFITTFSLLIDPATGRRVWREAVLFPGLVNLAVIVYTCFPRLCRWATRDLFRLLQVVPTPLYAHSVILLIYVWLAVSMAAAYLAKLAEPHKFGKIISPALVYVAGYGPLLCACTFSAYVKELRKAEMKWDKTEKTGKAATPV